MYKVLVLLAKGFEEIEAIAVIDILRRANVKVQICSTDKEYVTGSHGITVKSDVRIEFIDIYNDTYDLIYVPGGQPGVDNLAADDRVLELLKKYHEDGTLLAAICAGPKVLDTAGLLTDKEVTSYPTYKGKLNVKNYVDEVFVRSANVLTGRGPGTAMDMGFHILEAMGLPEEAVRLRQEMQYDFLLEKEK